jgi:hypothetical protein
MRNLFNRSRSENAAQRESRANLRQRATAPLAEEKSQATQPEVWRLALELGYTDAQVEAARTHGCQTPEKIVDYIVTHQVQPDGTLARAASRRTLQAAEPSGVSSQPAASGFATDQSTSSAADAEDEELKRAIELSRLEYLKSGRGSKPSTGDKTNALTGGVTKTENPLDLAADSELQRAIEASLEEERKARQRFELSIFRPAEKELDPAERLRASLSDPIGLCNVGNTCYLNSLLQVYYHLPFFVRRVFAWREHDVLDITKTPPKTIDIVRELQRLFAFLSLSERSYADPAGVLYALADTLNAAALELGAQQDLSEFNETFLRSIEAALQTQQEQAPLQKAFTHSFVQELHYEDKDAAAASIPVARETSRIEAGRSPDANAPPRSPDLARSPRLSAMIERLALLQSGECKLAHRVEGTTSSLILDVASGTCRDLYAALDEYVLATVEYQPEQIDAEASAVPGEQLPVSQISIRSKPTKAAIKSVWFQHIAPVFFIYLQRVRFNKDTRTAEKVNDRFEFAETIYLDRYMECHRAEALSVRSREAQQRLTYEQLERERLELLHLPGVLEPTDLVYEAILRRLREPEKQAEAHSGVESDETQREFRRQALELMSHVYITEKHQRERLETEMARLKDEMNANLSSLASERYRLEAVLVHEGAPEGGHYFVFIRANRGPNWYEFNDQRVNQVSWDHVHTIGCGGHGTASAYALLYRREDLDGHHDLPAAEEAKDLLPDSLVAEIAADNAALREEMERWRLRPMIAAISERLRQPANDESFYERPEWFCIHRGQMAEAVLLATCEVYSQLSNGANLLVSLGELGDAQTEARRDTRETAVDIDRFLAVMEMDASGPFADDIHRLATSLRQADRVTLQQLEAARCQAEQAHRVALRALFLTAIAFEWLREGAWRKAASAITTIYETASAGVSYASLTKSLRFCVERLVRQAEISDPELSAWIAYEYLPDKTTHLSASSKANPPEARQPRDPDVNRSPERQTLAGVPTRPELLPWEECILDDKKERLGGEEQVIRWCFRLIQEEMAIDRTDT